MVVAARAAHCFSPHWFGSRLREETGWGAAKAGMRGRRVFARQPRQTLAGGEKQWVALARARVLRPKLLLDEPAANHDGPARALGHSSYSCRLVYLSFFAMCWLT